MESRIWHADQDDFGPFDDADSDFRLVLSVRALLTELSLYENIYVFSWMSTYGYEVK